VSSYHEIRPQQGDFEWSTFKEKVMTEETERDGIQGDPSIDNDSHNDAQKGAAIGGIGGAVAGAVVGSTAGPVGTLAGAVIGGIVGAVSSKAAVGAIDRVEHEHGTIVPPADQTSVPIEPDAARKAMVDPATNPAVLPIPLPEGASTSIPVTADTPDTE
jgi:phage tail tape-measure protein